MSLAYSPSGQQLAAGTGNGFVWVWDFKSKPAVIGYHRRGRWFTFYNGSGIGGDLLRSEAGSRCHHWIHLIHHRGPADSVIDTVQNIDDPVDFVYLVRNFRRPITEQCLIRGEQLDLNIFRRASQVTDHVLQGLYEFDIQRRLLVRDLVAQVRHDFFDAAAALIF